MTVPRGSRNAPIRGITGRLRYRLARVKMVVTDPRARSEWLTMMRYGRQVHQDTSHTALDRYPALFTQVQAQLGRDTTAAILSFGSSSGEEVVTLRRYFPAARIVGAEINRARLAESRRLGLDARASFIASDPDRIAAWGPYAAIFCMAVFQRRPHLVERMGLRSIARRYPFALFARTLTHLVGQLAPGGLLVVENAQYLVADAPAARLLEPVDRASPGRSVLFGPDGRRIDADRPFSRIHRRRG